MKLYKVTGRRYCFVKQQEKDMQTAEMKFIGGATERKKADELRNCRTKAKLQTYSSRVQLTEKKEKAD